MLFILNLRLELIPRSPANCEMENYPFYRQPCRLRLLRVPPRFFRDISGALFWLALTSAKVAAPRLSSRRRRRRHHLMRRGLWFGRVYRSEGRRIYDYRRWLFFLSGLDRGGKRGIEHGQGNGFAENGDCT